MDTQQLNIRIINHGGTININYPTLEYKICSKCKESKPKTEFHKSKTITTGLQNNCKDCNKANSKKQREENPDYWREWYLNNREYYNEYQRNYHYNRYHNDINYRIKKCLYSRLYNLICYQQHSETLSDLLRCSDEFFMSWLKYQFDENMTESNYGRYWEIDHVLPISKFNMKNEDERRLIWDWKNIRPLEISENRSKGDKLDYNLYKYQCEKALAFTQLWDCKHNINTQDSNDSCNL